MQRKRLAYGIHVIAPRLAGSNQWVIARRTLIVDNKEYNPGDIIPYLCWKSPNDVLKEAYQVRLLTIEEDSIKLEGTIDTCNGEFGFINRSSVWSIKAGYLVPHSYAKKLPLSNTIKENEIGQIER